MGRRSGITRRRFLGTATGALAAASIAPARVLGANQALTLGLVSPPDPGSGWVHMGCRADVHQMYSGWRLAFGVQGAYV